MATVWHTFTIASNITGAWKPHKVYSRRRACIVFNRINFRHWTAGNIDEWVETDDGKVVQILAKKKVNQAGHYLFTFAFGRFVYSKDVPEAFRFKLLFGKNHCYTNHRDTGVIHGLDMDKAMENKLIEAIQAYTRMVLVRKVDWQVLTANYFGKSSLNNIKKLKSIFKMDEVAEMIKSEVLKAAGLKNINSETVFGWMQEAFEVAKTIKDPKAMISAAKEVGTIMGMYDKADPNDLGNASVEKEVDNAIANALESAERPQLPPASDDDLPDEDYGKYLDDK